MDETIFLGVYSLANFLFPMCLLPWLLKRGHVVLSVIIPICVFLILAQLNPKDFDFIERIWRGGLIGIVSVGLGFVYFHILKRTKHNEKSDL